MKRLFAVLTLIIVLLFSFSFALGEDTRTISLFFINVGKGDACLIQVDQRNYLVDVGPKDAHQMVLAALKASGVDHLDAVILTHTHKDHVGGLKKLMKSDISVEKLYYSAFYILDEDESHPVLEVSEKYNTPTQALSVGDQLELGEGVWLEVLAPMELNQGEENNNSLVMFLTTPYGTALLTGDMEGAEEQSLLRSGKLSQCDVLKVAHHGKNDATSKNFVLTVKPAYAIISTDTSEDNDTASSRVISRLMNAGCEVLLTQNSTLGIRVSFSPEGIVVEK